MKKLIALAALALVGCTPALSHPYTGHPPAPHCCPAGPEEREPDPR